MQTLQQLQREKEELQEKLSSLQCSLQKLQNERAEMEKVVARLNKDKSALRRALEKVSRLICRMTEAVFLKIHKPKIQFFG